MPNQENKTSIKPSHFLPSYLKLDLNVGVPEEHPFIAALDETLEGWCASSQCESLSMTRPHFPIERKRSVLEGYGFTLDALNNEEISALYGEIHNLFRNQGALSAVEILAKIYFPDQLVTVRRGRGLRRQTLKAPLTFPIVVQDRDGDDHTVHVSLTRNVNRQRSEDFKSNAMRFIPHGFQIVMQEPLKPEPEDMSKMDLSGSFRLTERRI